MHFHQKSPEYMQSQIAEFVRSGELDYNQKTTTSRQIGTLALSPEGTDVNGVVEKMVSKEPQEVTVSYEVYLDFLRNMSNEDRARLKYHETALQAYEIYRPSIDALLADVATYEDKTQHPQFLGKGTNGAAFRLDFDDTPLVVKQSHSNGERVDRVGASHSESAAFYIGNQIDHLQHQVAASPDSEIIITELLPGRTINTLSFEELASIPDDDIRQVIDLVITMAEHGLVFDPKISNVMYDPDEGFSILDYGLRASGDINPHDKASSFTQGLVPGLAPNISSSIKYDGSQRHDSAHNSQARLEGQLNGMFLQKRFLMVLDEFYPEIVDEWVVDQAEIEADPRRSGDVFINTTHLLVDESEELRDWQQYILSRGLSQKPRPPMTQEYATADEFWV